MASINIITTPEEQEVVLKALATVEGQTLSVTKIARLAKLNPNRVRFIILDLVDAGKVERIPTRAINSHYIRYSYKVVK